MPDVSCLRDADDTLILANVQDAVLSEDRTLHALDINTGLRVAHETALFLQSTAEEVDTEIAVLGCLRRCADLDHLAWTTLEDDNVSEADELTWYGDEVTRSTSTATFRNTDCINLLVSDGTRMMMVVMVTTTTSIVLNDDFFTLYTIAAVAMVMMVEWVQDMVGSSLDTTTEGVVLTVVIEVAHVVAIFLIVSGTSTIVSFSDVDICFEGAISSSAFVINVGVFLRASTINLDIDISSCLSWSSISISLSVRRHLRRKY